MGTRSTTSATLGHYRTGAKGTYLKRASLSSTMGPGVKLEVPSLLA